jgi:hypothetical protein
MQTGEENVPPPTPPIEPKPRNIKADIARETRKRRSMVCKSLDVAVKNVLAFLAISVSLWVKTHTGTFLLLLFFLEDNLQISLAFPPLDMDIFRRVWKRVKGVKAGNFAVPPDVVTSEINNVMEVGRSRFVPPDGGVVAPQSGAPSAPPTVVSSPLVPDAIVDAVALGFDVVAALSVIAPSRLERRRWMVSRAARDPQVTIRKRPNAGWEMVGVKKARLVEIAARTAARAPAMDVDRPRIFGLTREASDNIYAQDAARLEALRGTSARVGVIGRPVLVPPPPVHLPPPPPPPPVHLPPNVPAAPPPPPPSSVISRPATVILPMDDNDDSRMASPPTSPSHAVVPHISHAASPAEGRSCMICLTGEEELVADGMLLCPIIDGVDEDSPDKCVHLACARCMREMIDMFLRDISQSVLECVACRRNHARLNRKHIDAQARYMVDPATFVSELTPSQVLVLSSPAKANYLSAFTTVAFTTSGSTPYRRHNTERCQCCMNLVDGPMTLMCPNLARCTSVSCLIIMCVRCKEPAIHDDAGCPEMIRRAAMTSTFDPNVGRRCPYPGCGYSGLQHYRGDGCHLMDCPGCNKTFCFVCGATKTGNRHRPFDGRTCQCPLFCTSTCPCVIVPSNAPPALYV